MVFALKPPPLFFIVINYVCVCTEKNLSLPLLYAILISSLLSDSIFINQAKYGITIDVIVKRLKTVFNTLKNVYYKLCNPSILFIVLIFFSTCAIYAQETNSTSNLSKEVTTLEQLEKMRVGVFGASANKEIIEKKNPKITNFFFSNSISDAVAALKTNKIDCFAADVPVLQLYANRNPDLKVAPLKIETFNYGVALKKNSPLTEKISKVVKKFKEDGTLEKLKDLWQGKDESKKTIASIPKQDWEGKNGILKAYLHTLETTRN